MCTYIYTGSGKVMFQTFLSNICTKITCFNNSGEYPSILKGFNLIGRIKLDYKKDKIILAKELERLFGIETENRKYSISEFINNFISEEFRDDIKNKLYSNESKRCSLIAETKIISKGNEKKWIKISGKFFYRYNGNIKSFIGIVQDISSWKEKEIKLNSNVKFMQKLIDTMPTPVFYKDSMGIYRLCNVAFHNFLGKGKKDIIGYTAKEISPKKHGDIYYDADKKLMKNQGKQVYETKVIHADKTNRDVIFTKATFGDENEKTIGIIGVMTDITERKNFESKLSSLLTLKESALEIAHTVMEIENIDTLFDVILEKALKSIRNAQIGTILVLDEEENLTVSAYRGYNEKQAQKFSLPLSESLIYRKTNGNIKKAIIIENIEQLLIEKCSEILHNEGRLFIKSSISAPIIVNGKLYGLLNIDSEQNNVFDENDLEFMEYLRIQSALVIEKRLLYEKMILFSRYDELTGVYNRRYFEERLESQLKKSERYNEKFCLVLFDLNKFKDINDTYGHLIGDEVLKNFASTLKSNFRNSDIIGRFGGDEFVSLLYNNDRDTTISKIEKILEICRKDTMYFDNISLNYDFSYGVACYQENGTNFNDLIKDADKRMYENKRKL